MQIDLASSIVPMELVTVFSETLMATNYANRLLRLTDGTSITFGSNGTLSVVPPSVSLNIRRAAAGVALSWTNPAYALQSASAPNGTFTNVPGAASPFTNTITPGRKFFRLAN